MNLPVKSTKRERKVMLPLRGRIAVSSQMGSARASPLILGQQHIVGVDVEDVIFRIVRLVVDDRPLLHGARDERSD